MIKTTIQRRSCAAGDGGVWLASVYVRGELVAEAHCPTFWLALRFCCDERARLQVWTGATP